MRRCGKLTAAAAAAALLSLAVAGCTAGPARPGFAGYQWRVTAIIHGGHRTPVPAGDDVYLRFTSSGQFVANEPVNTHSGHYRRTGAGFATGELYVSAVGYAGRNPVTLLAISAISAFDDGAQASTAVTGDRLAVSVGGYRLICQRDGRQAPF